MVKRSRHRSAPSPPGTGLVPGLAQRRGPFRAPRTWAAAATALAGLALSIAASAHADTARLVHDGEPKLGDPTSSAITITATDGTTRTLGPYRFRHVPTELTSSPDGRYLAVGLRPTDQSHQVTIVPTDGSGPFALRVEPRIPVVTSAADFSWSTDGGELIVGHAKDPRINRRRGVDRSVALRCPLATRVCREIPDSEGLAAAVPGGVVTSTPLDDVLPRDLAYAGHGLTSTIDARPSRQSRVERGFLRELRRRRSARTTVAGEDTRTVAAATSSIAGGIAPASSIVGGPSAALVTHTRYRMLIIRRGTTLRLRARTGPRRWERIRADGSRRVGPVRFLRIPKADGTTGGRGRKLQAQRFPVVPRTSIAIGGWLGTVGPPAQVRTVGPDALALATIDESGTARFVRFGGRIASATALVRSVLQRVPSRGLSSLRVVGYEAASNAAIVAVDWVEGSAEMAMFGTVGPPPEADRPSAHVATVRVPLDGRTPPSIVSRTKEQAAW